MFHQVSDGRPQCFTTYHPAHVCVPKTCSAHESKWLPNVGEPNVCESQKLSAHLSREAKQLRDYRLARAVAMTFRACDASPINFLIHPDASCIFFSHTLSRVGHSQVVRVFPKWISNRRCGKSWQRSCARVNPNGGRSTVGGDGEVFTFLLFASRTATRSCLPLKRLKRDASTCPTLARQSRFDARDAALIFRRR